MPERWSLRDEDRFRMHCGLGRPAFNGNRHFGFGMSESDRSSPISSGSPMRGMGAKKSPRRVARPCAGELKQGGLVAAGLTSGRFGPCRSHPTVRVSGSRSIQPFRAVRYSLHEKGNDKEVISLRCDGHSRITEPRLGGFRFVKVYCRFRGMQSTESRRFMIDGDRSPSSVHELRKNAFRGS